MTKEIPILFSTPMVQALLAGRKTQTRRIMKPHHRWLWENWEGESILKDCPYGQPGDLLWVRESWNICIKSELAPDDPYMQRNDGIPEGQWVWVYKAGSTHETNTEHPEWGKKLWKPSIYLPKAAARIWLEVTGVRVERLQNISPGDACDEGINYWNIDPEAMEGGELQADFENYTWSEKKENDPNYEDRYFPTFANPVDSFRSLWQSINGPESWEANPWVWVVEYKVLSTTGKPGI